MSATANKAELAELLGLSLPTLDAMVRRGCPVLQRGAQGREWCFDVPAVIKWRTDRAVAAALGDTSKLDQEEARRRKLAAEAALAELDLAERRREMIRVEDAAALVADEYAKVRSRLLDLPARLAPLVAIEADPAACERLVREEVKDTLEELTADADAREAA